MYWVNEPLFHRQQSTATFVYTLHRKQITKQLIGFPMHSILSFAQFGPVHPGAQAQT